LFRRILAAVASVESASLAVVDGHESGEYLSRVPLFADLFENGHLTFPKVLVAIVERSATNETIRRIENVTGPLDGQHAVMVTVQDVFYSAGSLGAYVQHVEEGVWLFAAAPDSICRLTFGCARDNAGA
jgi:hypothetical protein